MPVRQGLFSGAGVDHDAEALGDEVARGCRVALHRPALCAPSCTGVDEDSGAAVGKDLGGPGIGIGVDRKPGRHGGQIVPGNGGSQLEILLDDVDPSRDNFLGIQPTGGELAGFGFTDQARAAGHAGNPRQTAVRPANR